jgi:hypothetical protein
LPVMAWAGGGIGKMALAGGFYGIGAAGASPQSAALPSSPEPP